jgi:hypothetical protein
MTGPKKVDAVSLSAAALVTALVQTGMTDEAVELVEWCEDALDLNVSHALPAELEEELDD